ncbi:hypothetical protein [Sphingomonas sp.]|uniref:hypothetical protein n=1 Tax=Sphingomonas sp. TaxID=28214 RepID=UPI00286A83C3|nr:hypothetical protein [Sphingomonas sp.]
MKRLCVWTMLALGAVSPTRATTMVSEKFVCPVGGEKFSANVIASMTSWGSRPDGRRYGTTPIVPLTECPKNGFVYFSEKFDAADSAALTPLVLGTEYQSLRKSETPHYRAWWLMNKLNRDPLDQAWMLLVASWESDGSPDRKVRYQRAFVDAARALSWSKDKAEDIFWTNVRAANALRELGQFDQSNALLDQIDVADKRPTNLDQLKGATQLIGELRKLNSEHNPALEPANMVPVMVAAERCKASSPALTAVETATCASDEVKQAMLRLEANR